MSTFTRLRSWTTRTFYKGMRERWPLRWWWRFARQVWRERRSVFAQLNRVHFDIDLRVRRLTRRHGEAGMIHAMCRMQNASFARMRWKNEEIYRRQKELAAKAAERAKAEAENPSSPEEIDDWAWRLADEAAELTD